MGCALEHGNITVRSIDAVVSFLTTALPELRVRGSSTNPRWVHLGTDTCYIALGEATRESSGERVPYAETGVNHLGFAVDDVNALRERLTAAGYREHLKDDAHPFRRRSYFRDAEGNEWEFVQYLSDDPAERNDYSL